MLAPHTAPPDADDDDLPPELAAYYHIHGGGQTADGQPANNVDVQDVPLPFA